MKLLIDKLILHWNKLYIPIYIIDLKISNSCSWSWSRILSAEYGSRDLIMYPLYFLSYIHNGLFCQSENEDAVRRKLEMDTEEVAKQGILYSLGQLWSYVRPSWLHCVSGKVAILLVITQWMIKMIYNGHYILWCCCNYNKNKHSTLRVFGRTDSDRCC